MVEVINDEIMEPINFGESLQTGNIIREIWPTILAYDQNSWRNLQEMRLPRASYTGPRNWRPLTVETDTEESSTCCDGLLDPDG